MRARLDAWIEKTGDQGSVPESTAMYDSDMAVYLKTLNRKNNPGHLKMVQDNIARMKRWAAEGK